MSATNPEMEALKTRLKAIKLTNITWASPNK